MLTEGIFLSYLIKALNLSFFQKMDVNILITTNWLYLREEEPVAL